jgi:hypothetical protein
VKFFRDRLPDGTTYAVLRLSPALVTPGTKPTRLELPNSLGPEYSWVMSSQVAPPVVARKRANQNWGRPFAATPDLPTQFEMQIEQLGLTPETYAHSEELRSWCKENRNRCYVPEWLLKVWDMSVDPDLSGAARHAE